MGKSNKVATKLAALRDRMRAHGVDLVALGPGAHMRWLLGFIPHPDERPCLLLIGPERESFLMPALNADAARADAARAETTLSMHGWADADGPDAALAGALSEAGATSATRVALDETMRADFALLLLDRLPGATRTFGDETVGALRLVKDNEDYAELKANALIADRAVQAVFDAARPGVSEKTLAGIARAHFVSEGAAPQFAIVAAGPHGAFPHHQPGDRVLKNGDAVIVDIGGRKGLYSSDITRSVVIGEVPEGYRAVHDVVEQAVGAAMAAARPGVAARSVDKAARNTIAAAGYGEYFVHRTGHGLGVEIHEPPYVTATSDRLLESGMVFSIEPGIYLPDRFGVRLEEIVILRDAGPEILSERRRDFHLVGS